MNCKLLAQYYGTVEKLLNLLIYIQIKNKIIPLRIYKDGLQNF